MSVCGQCVQLGQIECLCLVIQPSLSYCHYSTQCFVLNYLKLKTNFELECYLEFRHAILNDILKGSNVLFHKCLVIAGYVSLRICIVESLATVHNLAQLFIHVVSIIINIPTRIALHDQITNTAKQLNNPCLRLDIKINAKTNSHLLLLTPKKYKKQDHITLASRQVQLSFGTLVSTFTRCQLHGFDIEFRSHRL